MGIGDEFRDMVLKRTGLRREKLVCPREKSDMTPCVARDGDLAMTSDGRCVGCNASISMLLEEEKVRVGV